MVNEIVTLILIDLQLLFLSFVAILNTHQI